MKIYLVDILTSGQWKNVIVGPRVFFSRIEAYNFYLRITRVNKCEADFYKLQRLSGTCFGIEKRIEQIVIKFTIFFFMRTYVRGRARFPCKNRANLFIEFFLTFLKLFHFRG